MTTAFDRRSFLKIVGTTTAAAGLAATLQACAPKANDGSSGSSGSSNSGGKENKDGTIDAAISYELGTNGYDPMTTTAALTVAANWHTLEGLTEMDPSNGKVYAALAKELPTSDGTSVDIALRDGAKFHNDTPVTADDVVFSFERVLDKANKSLYASFIPFIKSVAKKDDKTVTIELEHPTAVLADRLAVVKIVPKSAVDADKKAFDALPVGTGPYKMTDNGGVSKVIAFERFDAYNGPRPARAKKMNWKIIPDASTRTNAIQSKTVQAIDSVPYLSMDQLKASSKVESVLGFGLLFAMFNHDKSSPFSDVRNRQAFFYGIDMDKVLKTGMRDQAEAATSFLQSNHPQYKKASSVYTYKPETARELINQTGLKKMRLLCTDHDWVKNCTPLIQESLSGLGLEVEFTEKKSSDVYNTIDGKPEAYDVVIAPGDPSVFGNDPDLLMRWWYGNDTWADGRMHWKGTDSYNQVQELLGKGLQTTDEKEQEKLWGELFDLLSTELPLYPLFHRKSPTAWDSATLVDFTPISLTGLSFVGVGTSK